MNSNNSNSNNNDKSLDFRASDEEDQKEEQKEEVILQLTRDDFESDHEDEAVGGKTGSLAPDDLNGDPKLVGEERGRDVHVHANTILPLKESQGRDEIVKEPTKGERGGDNLDLQRNIDRLSELMGSNVDTEPTDMDDLRVLIIADADDTEKDDRANQEDTTGPNRLTTGTSTPGAVAIAGIGGPRSQPSHAVNSFDRDEESQSFAFHLTAELAPSSSNEVRNSLNHTSTAVPMVDPKIVHRRRRRLGAGFTLVAIAGIVATVVGMHLKPKKAPVFVGAPSISMSPSPQPSNSPSVSLLPSGRPSLSPSSSMSPTSLLERLNDIVAIYPEKGVPDPETPQFKALVWLSENQMFHEYEQDELRTRYAISTWVFTNRRANTSLPPFLTDASHCTWPGITCGPQFNSSSTTTFRPVWGIYGLDLFQGKEFYFTPELAILSNTLKSLIVNRVIVLEIYDGGTIPSEFGMLTELTDLTIDDTKIKGTIPSSLGSLTKLQKLVLKNSDWTGELPALGLLTNLEFLDLSVCRFLSKNTIPTEIGTFSHLLDLTLAYGILVGTIPTELSLLSKLTKLNLAQNSLVTNVPGDLFAKLTNLRHLDFSDNSLTDFRIPTSIGYLTDLTALILNSANVAGTIPTELALLTKLRGIRLLSNKLTGTIPSLPGLTNLQELRLNSNSLSGVIDCNLYAVAPVVDCDRVKCECCQVYVSSIDGVVSLPCSSIPLLNSSEVVIVTPTMTVAPSVPASTSASPGTTVAPVTTAPTVSVALFDFLSNSSADGGVSLSTLGTPQQKAMQWLQNEFIEWNETMTFNYYLLQTYALATLSYEWDLSLYPPWLRGVNGCTWKGVGCTEELEVSTLILTLSGVSGSLPLEIYLMSSLTSVECLYCDLSGEISSEIGQLTKLTSFNMLGSSFASVAAELGQSTSLAYLDVSSSGTLFGTIPSELGMLSMLTSLNFASNKFVGSIPSEIGRLTSLTNLNVRTYRSGRIPSEIGLLTSLQRLDLSGNDHTGSLISEISQLTSLISLYVQGNRLTGTVTTEIGRLTSLAELFLDANQFTGKLPSEIGLTAIGMLTVNSNQFTGELPTEFGQLNAYALYVSNTSLTGTVPLEVCQTATYLSYGPPVLCETRFSEVGPYDVCQDASSLSNGPPLVCNCGPICSLVAPPS